MYLPTASGPVMLSMTKTPADVDKYIYIPELVLAIVITDWTGSGLN